MSYTTFFGDPWPSDVCERARQVDVPVGKPCLHCQEQIEPDDQGLFTTLVVAIGDVQTHPEHRECALRVVVGGIGHLEDHTYWCEAVGDPDGGRTFRQSALEVWDWVRVHGDPPAVDR